MVLRIAWHMNLFVLLAGSRATEYGWKVGKLVLVYVLAKKESCFSLCFWIGWSLVGAWMEIPG